MTKKIKQTDTVTLPLYGRVRDILHAVSGESEGAQSVLDNQSRNKGQTSDAVRRNLRLHAISATVSRKSVSEYPASLFQFSVLSSGLAQ
jgi:hypothetical protein